MKSKLAFECFPFSCQMCTDFKESVRNLDLLIGFKEFENKISTKMPPPHTTEKLYETFILLILKFQVLSQKVHTSMCTALVASFKDVCKMISIGKSFTLDFTRCRHRRVQMNSVLFLFNKSKKKTTKIIQNQLFHVKF